MSRTKTAIIATAFALGDTMGPTWLVLVWEVAQLAAIAYVLWFAWSDTTPHESYTVRARRRQERRQ